jgi:cation-dependent mannose-6-phosphate receptor
VRGYDYGANFTVNFCAPVVENLTDVVGIEESRWQNVSAFYEKEGKTYSIGSESSLPVFRGRKLVLNYTDGSPCYAQKNQTEVLHRKSSIFSFLCERDPTSPDVSISFVGASNDECAYFFEVRTAAACGGVSDTPQTLGPAGVFGVIAFIALLVYLVGGCVYNRTVMHARGWRQVPNYPLWAGAGGFIKVGSDYMKIS